MSECSTIVTSYHFHIHYNYAINIMITVVQYYFSLTIQFNDILKVIIAKVNVVDACR